jgi:hypothetical protein
VGEWRDDAEKFGLGQRYLSDICQEGTLALLPSPKSYI